MISYVRQEMLLNAVQLQEYSATLIELVTERNCCADKSYVRLLLGNIATQLARLRTVEERLDMPEVSRHDAEKARAAYDDAEQERLLRNDCEAEAAVQIAGR